MITPLSTQAIANSSDGQYEDELEVKSVTVENHPSTSIIIEITCSVYFQKDHDHLPSLDVYTVSHKALALSLKLGSIVNASNDNINNTVDMSLILF